MCLPFVAPLMSALGVGGAAAATGATAAAGLASFGTILSAVGTVAAGVSAARSARANANQIEQQRKTEMSLASVKDQRERVQFMSKIREQAAQLAGHGVSLNSPTAVLLGDYAAREMSFNSQATRSGAMARDTELSASAQSMRAQGRMALLKGGLGAASNLLTAAPDVWPELLR